MASERPDRAPADEERRREAIERGRGILASQLPETFAPANDGRTIWPVLLAAAIMLALGAALYIFLPPIGGFSDAEVRDQIIKESIAAYQAGGHPCACPYNVMANGQQCGDFSAYGKPGVAALLCYPKDVSAAAVRGWRERNDR